MAYSTIGMQCLIASRTHQSQDESYSKVVSLETV